MNRRSLLAGAAATLAFGSAGGMLAVAAVPAPDPMLVAMADYQRQLVIFLNECEDRPDADVGEIGDRTYMPIYCAETQPVPTTKAGAAAGLRMLLEDNGDDLGSQFSNAIFAAVLAFLEGRAS